MISIALKTEQYDTKTFADRFHDTINYGIVCCSFYCTRPVKFSSHNFWEKYKLRLLLSKFCCLWEIRNVRRLKSQWAFSIKQKTNAFWFWIVNREYELWTEWRGGGVGVRIASDLHIIYMHMHVFNFFSRFNRFVIFLPFFRAHVCVFVCACFYSKSFATNIYFPLTLGNKHLRSRRSIR